MKASDIINKLTNELSTNTLIKALVLVGSQARKKIYEASEYSDIEVYIVVEDKDVEEMEKQLLSVVSNIGNNIFSYKNRWAGFSTVFEDLSRLELPVVKLSELNLVFSRPKAQEVKVLFDKTDGLLHASLDKRTDSMDFEELFAYEVTDFWYMVIVGVQYYKKGESWNSRSVLQILQSSLIKLFELYNDPNILLLETNKRIEEFLTHEQINMLKEVSPAYDNNEIVHAFEKIIDTFPRISRQVKGKYGYYYDEKIEKQISAQLLNLLKS